MSTRLAIALAVCAAAHGSVCDSASAITGFNATEYLGTWYQIAVSKEIMEQTEAKYPFCVTADYSANPNGFINVVNSAYDGSGDKTSITGKATQADPTVAALEVSFYGPFAAPYNVIKMLTDAQGKYKTALVWSCSLGGLAQGLWVLSREKAISNEDYNTMLSYAESTGIDVAGLQMQKTVQNCTNGARASEREAVKARADACGSAGPLTGFNTTAYLGKWYQIAVSKEFQEAFEARYPLCVTAEYSMNAGGFVNVLNTGYDAAGDFTSATGKATQADPTVAALEVSFFGPFSSPYNVIKMLTDAQGKYKTALVWSCSLGGLEQALWVLSRDRSIPDADYNAMLTFASQHDINVGGLGMMKTVQNCTN